MFLGQFGTPSYAGLAYKWQRSAGNSFSSELVKYGDDLYLYTNDENVALGVHGWKIGNINSIQLQNIAL